MKVRSVFGIGFFWVGLAAAAVGVAPVNGAKNAPLTEWDEKALWSGLHEQFLLTEEAMARFDQELQQNGGAVASFGTTSPTYARLLALREWHEALEAELEGRLGVSFLLESNQDTGAGFEGWVRKRAEQMRSKLKIRAKSFWFSAASVIEFAKQSDQERGFGLESLSGPVALEELRAWRNDFRKSGGGAPDLRELRSQIEVRASEIKSGIESLRLENESLGSELRVFPSIGSSGSLSGNSFKNGTWSLTFDDGPGPLTASVLKNLKTHQLRASFFVLTEQLQKSSEFASSSREAIQDGHDVLSHSYHHLKIPSLSQDAQKEEIEGALVDFEAILGFRPGLFRLPFGAGVSVSQVRENLVKSCQVHVFWNVDTLDWHDPDPSLIVERTLAQIRKLGRGVILFHDIHRQSVIASERVMGFLNSEGLKVLPVSEQIRELNGEKTWSCNSSW